MRTIRAMSRTGRKWLGRLATGYTVARGADHTAGAFALTLIATALLAWTRVNPVWVLIVATLAGIVGVA